MMMYPLRNAIAELAGAVSGAVTLTGPVLSLIFFVFNALALYTLAERRGIRHSWLAWVPVVNIWVLGSLSDQYRYVTRGEIRSRRKVLLTLRILSSVLSAVLVCIAAVVSVGLIGVILGELERFHFAEWVMGPSIGMLGLGLPLLGIAIAYAIFHYMALYDLFLSCDPQNAVLFLVLSIFVGVTRPFFLFACRNKDYGMPARRDAFRPGDGPME